MFFFRRFIMASFLSLHFSELTFLSKDYIFAPQTRSHSKYRYVTNLKKNQTKTTKVCSCIVNIRPTSFKGDIRRVSDRVPANFARTSNVSKLLHVFASWSLLTIFSTSRSLATSPNKSSTSTFEKNKKIKELLVADLTWINYLTICTVFPTGSQNWAKNLGD